MTSSSMQTPSPRYTYQYPMVSVATDIVLMNLPRHGGLRVALVRRSPESDAYPNSWALPGGFLQAENDFDIDACVRRELLEEVGVENPPIELIGIYSAIRRDPRPERVISVAYLSVLLSDEPEVAPIVGTDVVEARWVPLTELVSGTYEGKPLAFDHAKIIEDARRLLDARVPFGRKEDLPPDLLFAFLPEEFTLGHATEVVTHLKGKVDPSNFRKYILPFVEATGSSQRTSTRSAAVYRRRMPRSEPPKELPAGLQRLQRIAKGAQVGLFDLFLATLTQASDDVVRMIRWILTAYAHHRDYEVKVTRAPELRIMDLATGRALLAVACTPQGQLLGKALATPSTLEHLGLQDLRATASGPLQSSFIVRLGDDGADLFDEMLRLSRVTLVTE